MKFIDYKQSLGTETMPSTYPTSHNRVFSHTSSVRLPSQLQVNRDRVASQILTSHVTRSGSTKDILPSPPHPCRCHLHCCSSEKSYSIRHRTADQLGTIPMQ